MAQGSAQLAALRDAEKSLLESMTGADDNGIVTLEAENQRLTKVTLARSWQDGGLAGLTAGFQGAYQAMSVASRVRYFERIAEAQQAAQRSGSDTPRSTTEAFGRPFVAPTHAEADALIAQVVAGFAKLDQLEQTQPPSSTYQAPEAIEVRGTSANGRMTAVFVASGGDDNLTEFVVDENWLLRQSPLQVAEMIKESVNAAFEGATHVKATPNAYQQLASEFGRTAQSARATARRAGLI